MQCAIDVSSICEMPHSPYGAAAALAPVAPPIPSAKGGSPSTICTPPAKRMCAEPELATEEKRADVAELPPVPVFPVLAEIKVMVFFLISMHCM